MLKKTKKNADQLHGFREADPRLRFHYTDSTIPLLSKYKISSLFWGTDKNPLGQKPTRTKTHWTKTHRTKTHCNFWQGGQKPTPSKKV